MKLYLSDELKGRIDTNKSQECLKDEHTMCYVQNIDINKGYVYLQYHSKSLTLKSKITFTCFTLGDKVNYFSSPVAFKLISIKKDDNKLLVTIFIEENLFWEKLNEKDND
jgi:hypothetical protein